MLKPLEEFICDKCNQIINNPDEGYLEWIKLAGKPAAKFRIVHHSLHSPYRDNGWDCYHYTKYKGRMDWKLKIFVGNMGLADLLSIIDVEKVFMKDNDDVHFVNDEEFSEIFRRLQIPYYEEARMYWHIAEQDGYINYNSNILAYTPENLKILINKYG